MVLGRGLCREEGDIHTFEYTHIHIGARKHEHANTNTKTNTRAAHIDSATI